MIAEPHSQLANAEAERRHDLDWLRVLAILLLLFFHCGMPFVAEWGWHIKNSETSEIFLEWMHFLSRWRMALLFFVSGAGTWFVMKRASASEYLRRRFLRLFVPLVFGILVVVPPQIYIERLFQSGSHSPYSSYWAFYPSVFEFRPYPEGNTSWHHLWFVAYLFLYSILGVPFFLALRSESGRRLAGRLAGNLSAPLVYSFGLPIAAVFASLIIRFRGPQNLVDDWAMFLTYFLYFLCGYLFTMERRFADWLEQNRERSLGLACLCYVSLAYFRWNDLEPAWAYSLANLLFLGLAALNAWFWVLALLGFGRRYLNRPNRWLRYANEAIYPFYILHQTVIVVLGFYVIRTSDTVLVKFLFLSVSSGAVTMVLYHFLVRPWALTRFLFGMQPEKTKLARLVPGVSLR